MIANVEQTSTPILHNISSNWHTELVSREAQPHIMRRDRMPMAQSSTELLLGKAAFARVVREEACKHAQRDDVRFESEALLALQKGTEAYLVGLFADASLCAAHGNCRGIRFQDIRLALRLRGES